jgi:hypothetical protein
MTTTTQNILIGLGAFAAAAYIFKSKDSAAVGYTGPATVRKTLNHLNKAQNLLWNTGAEWVMDREDQLKIGEARVSLIEIIEKYGYKPVYGENKLEKI